MSFIPADEYIDDCQVQYSKVQQDEGKKKYIITFLVYSDLLL